METISYSDARAQLAATMDKVISDHAPVIITRHGSQACVLVSLDDWESMEETNYLRSSPVNAQRLTESIHELESGGPGIVNQDADDFLRS
jgi:antitoxin YefM